MTFKRAIVSRSIVGVGLVSAAVCLIAGSGTASATVTVPFNCPTTIPVEVSSSTGLPDDWSGPRQMLTLVAATVSPATGGSTLNCAYGGSATSPAVANIYKTTTARCTANASRAGFDCDRAL